MKLKQGILIGLVMLAVVAMLSFAMATPTVQAQATNTPTPSNTPTVTPTPTNTPFPVSRVGQSGGTWLCRTVSIDCLQSRNGGGIHFYRSDGIQTFSVLPATGNITTLGSLAVGPEGIKCVQGSQTVLGAATVIPATLTAAGITTPTWADESFAASPGNAYWNSYHTNSAGVVTLGVYQNILSGTVTPQAATTSVAMDYEICGR